MNEHDTLIDPTTTGPFKPPEAASPTITVLAGSDAGRVFTLESGTMVVGRSTPSVIHIEHESISRQHCEITVSAVNRVLIRDLNSTNGTRINDKDIGSQTIELRGGERIRLSKHVVLKFAFQDPLEREMQEDLYSSAVRDPLTGVHNKRFFQERLDHEIAYATRHGTALSLLMFDLDHFKNVNDTHGHPVGDTVLVELAQRVQKALRSEDVFARYGGEEFAIIMRGTPIVEAERVGRRILQSVREQPIPSGDLHIPLTVSIGIAAFRSEQPATSGDFVSQTDQLLYEAKQEGRDRLVSSLVGDDL